MLARSLLVELESRYVTCGRGRLLGLRLSSLTCPAALVGGVFCLSKFARACQMKIPSGHSATIANWPLMTLSGHRIGFNAGSAPLIEPPAGLAVSSAISLPRPQASLKARCLKSASRALILGSSMTAWSLTKKLARRPVNRFLFVPPARQCYLVRCRIALRCLGRIPRG
jgi:hypothetical protein